jgi:hypothetical protein
MCFASADRTTMSLTVRSASACLRRTTMSSPWRSTDGSSSLASIAFHPAIPRRFDAISSATFRAGERHSAGARQVDDRLGLTVSRGLSVDEVQSSDESREDPSEGVLVRLFHHDPSSPAPADAKQDHVGGVHEWFEDSLDVHAAAPRARQRELRLSVSHARRSRASTE